MPPVPVFFSLPGASLMRVTLEADSAVRVECPGCGAVQVYHPRSGQVQHRAFWHADDDCEVLAAIDRALLIAQAPKESQ